MISMGHEINISERELMIKTPGEFADLKALYIQRHDYKNQDE